MVARKDIARIVSGYENPRIGVLGSHSALEIMDGAKDENFQTVVFCQKGREAPYKKFSRIADEIIVMNKFSDMASVKAQKKMISTNTIVVPHRSLTAYTKLSKNSPFQCNRMLFRPEERDEKIILSFKKGRHRYPSKLHDAPAILGNSQDAPVSSHKDYIHQKKRYKLIVLCRNYTKICICVRLAI